MEFSGRLASFPIADLLNWAVNDRRTGSLELRRSSRQKEIFFRDGNVVACLSDSPLEYYGQHLLLEGYLEPQTLLRCLMKCQEEGKRLGAVLVDEGILDIEVVQRTLRELIEDLVCDVFLWDRGIFLFRAEQPPEEEILAHPINTLGLVLEGSRWVDEMKRIRELIRHDNLSVRKLKNPDVDPDSLGPRAAAIVDKLKRQTTVELLHEATGGSYFRFLSELYDLHERKVVKVIDHGARHPTTTFELPLPSMLLEQAAEEQRVRPISVPLDALENFVPAWIRQPTPEEWQRMDDAERGFLEQFDGRRRLKDMLSADRDARTLETELLILQMRRAAIALVPAPLEDLEIEREDA